MLTNITTINGFITRAKMPVCADQIRANATSACPKPPQVLGTTPLVMHPMAKPQPLTSAPDLR